MTRDEKDIKDNIYWKSLYALLRVTRTFLKLLNIFDSDKPVLDRLYLLSYKAQCVIENSKKPLDVVTFLVRSLINADDEVDATYS